MQLSWNRSRVNMPGCGTPISSSSPNASKLIPACATISAYSIGGTLPRALGVVFAERVA